MPDRFLPHQVALCSVDGVDCLVLSEMQQFDVYRRFRDDCTAKLKLWEQNGSITARIMRHSDIEYGAADIICMACTYPVIFIAGIEEWC